MCDNCKFVEKLRKLGIEKAEGRGCHESKVIVNLLEE